MAMPGVETMRLRRPPKVGADTWKGITPEPPKPAIVPSRRNQRSIWFPSLSLAFRLLVLLRFCAAMYANIQDCDEVYNFWEPLHYLQHSIGFQTWETSPNYAIRSWSYILLHLPFAQGVTYLQGVSKRRSFFAVRAILAFVSSFCEAKFYRSVGENINDHLARYLLFMLMFSPGMWQASSAFLPSSFSMHFTLLALSYAVQPASKSNTSRTLSAVVSFAIGAVVGWPFALLLSVPFVFEELFVWSGDLVPTNMQAVWFFGRLKRLILCGLIAAFVFVPVISLDSLAYGKLVVVPWNIVKYNVFGSEGRGPELYGTEPWYFYLQNLLLNFNIILPLALASLPALALTHTFDYRRLGLQKHRPDQSSPYTLFTLRLAPLYLWLAVLSLQPHKEERFMYPAYPLVCFNAATTLFLVRGYFEALYIKATTVYAASQTKLFRRFTLLVIVASVVLSGSRILAQFEYYHAPFDILYSLEYTEVPRLLNATGLLPPPRPKTPYDNAAYADEEYIDISAVKQLGLRVCYGKEWYRFPSHYHVPEGVEVQFIKSGFSGLLPQHFQVSEPSPQGLWKHKETRIAPPGMNDLNIENPSVYVDVDSCDYLIDLDFPLRAPSDNEPRYAIDTTRWDRVACLPFLDAANSPVHTRAFWTGLPSWQAQNHFGDYCLLRNKDRVAKIKAKKWQREQ